MTYIFVFPPPGSLGTSIVMLSLVRLIAPPLIALLLPLRALTSELHESFAEPYRKMDLAPAETGVVTQLAVEEGAKVKVGQVLVALDQDVLNVSRDIADAAVKSEGRQKSADAELRLREARLKKLRELHAKGHASREEIYRAEAELEAADGQVRALGEQRKIEILEVKKIDAMIERRLVRSPIDGIVTKLHREQGEFVTPVAPTVVTVVQLRPLRAVFHLPQSVGKEMKPGRQLQLHVPELELNVPGRVEFVAPIVDAESETVRVKILIDDPEERLTAGSRCVLNTSEITPAASDSVVNR